MKFVSPPPFAQAGVGPTRSKILLTTSVISGCYHRINAESLMNRAVSAGSAENLVRTHYAERCADIIRTNQRSRHQGDSGGRRPGPAGLSRCWRRRLRARVMARTPGSGGRATEPPIPGAAGGQRCDAGSWVASARLPPRLSGTVRATNGAVKMAQFNIDGNAELTQQSRIQSIPASTRSRTAGRSTALSVHRSRIWSGSSYSDSRLPDSRRWGLAGVKHEVAPIANLLRVQALRRNRGMPVTPVSGTKLVMGRS
jgi:hypothetical protein